MTADAAKVRLVVNADDFGLAEGISRGILRSHEEGIVTSTSVIGNCEDPAAVKNQLAAAPKLGVGIHLALVGGRPVSPADRIRSLVDDRGVFPSRAREVYVRWAKGGLNEGELEEELEAQVSRLEAAGLSLDHLNTHMHLGFLPPVARVMERIAHRHHIAGLRSSVESPTLTWFVDPPRGGPLAVMAGLAWYTRRQLGSLRHGPQTWGFAESGRLDVVRILEILGRLTPGPHELICHPAFPQPGTRFDVRYDGPREVEALTSPILKDALSRRQIELCRWQDLF